MWTGIGVGATVLLLVASGCSGGRARTHARRDADAATVPGPVAASAAVPSSAAEAREEPPVVLAVGTRAESPAVPTVESLAPADEISPVDPDALAIEQICADSRVRVVEAIGRYTRDLEGTEKATLADLARESPMTEGAFLDNVGVGYWGPADIDGDGADDRVLRYTSTDFWSHFLFLKKGECFRFAGSLEGYQIEVTRAKGATPRARVHTYPIGPSSRVEAYSWNGAYFQPRMP